MTTLNFEEDNVPSVDLDKESSVVSGGETSNLACPIVSTAQEVTTAQTDTYTSIAGTFATQSVTTACENVHLMKSLALIDNSGEDHLLHTLIKQTQENNILLNKALSELKELRSQVERRHPFTVKTCGFERELTTRAKELFISYGPWLVHGPLEKLKEKIIELLGGMQKADSYHVNACISYSKDRYTLWRAEIRKKVLNKKLNRLRIQEFADKLYAPFKSKEEDKKNAIKTAMLLRKFAVENGYYDDVTKADFWEKFVEFVNVWNNLNLTNKWKNLQQDDEDKFKETLNLQT